MYICIPGGCDPEGKATNVAEVYNFTTKLWHQLPNMPTCRAACTGMVFHEKKIILIGGLDEKQVPLAAVDVFDIEKETWEQYPPLPKGVVGPYIIKIKDKIYVFGGTDKKDANQSVVFDLDRNEWSPLPKMPTRRYSVGGYLYNNKVYIVGGRDGKNPRPACEAFDLETQQWEKLTDMHSCRVFYNVVGHKDYIYVLGGLVPMVGLSKMVERYSIKEDKWTRLSDLNLPRSDGSVGVVGDKVILAAGLGMVKNEAKVMTDVLAFKGDSMKKIASMPQGRSSPSTTVFDGKLAVIGGVGEGGPKKTVYILSYV